jgi:hypothetical protein
MSYSLRNDWVLGPIAIIIRDFEGNVIDPPPVDVIFSSTLNIPGVLDVVDNDGLHFTMNALTRTGTVVITHHDSSGQLADYTDTIVIVSAPASAGSDFAGAPHSTQAVPAP